MIYLNIALWVLILVSFIIIFFMNARMAKMNDKIEKNKNEHERRAMDIEKKIGVIIRKKW